MHESQPTTNVEFQKLRNPNIYHLLDLLNV